MRVRIGEFVAAVCVVAWGVARGRPLARSVRCRTRNRRLGPLVQHPPPPPRPGRHHTTTSRKPTHNNTKGSGLNKPPQNPGLDKQREGRCTRYGALHPLRGATPDQKGCTAYGSGAAHPITRTNAESARRRHAANTPAASSSCCKPPLPNSGPLHRGRILMVPMESAPAGQVAVAGTVVRPESDNGNHPSKSRT